MITDNLRNVDIGEPRRVIVVDDDAEFAEGLEIVLSPEGYAVEIDRHGNIGNGDVLLMKPFRKTDLAHTVIPRVSDRDP